MAAIVSWIAIGTIIGFAAGTFSSAKLPGGRLGSAIVGAAGAFVGGGIVTLFASRSMRSVDVLTLAVAAATAAVVVGATKKAQYAEPRPYSGR